jgi:hypothetical protein
MLFFSLFTLMTLLHVLIIIGVSYRVIKMRLPVAVSLACLLVFFLALAGAIAHIVLGEKHLGINLRSGPRTLNAVVTAG